MTKIPQSPEESPKVTGFHCLMVNVYRCILNFKLKYKLLADVVDYACNPSPWEVKAEEWRVQGHSQLHREFEVSLGCAILSLEQNLNTKNLLLSQSSSLCFFCFFFFSKFLWKFQKVGVKLNRTAINVRNITRTVWLQKFPRSEWKGAAFLFL